MKSIPSDLPDVPGLTNIDYIQSCMLDIKVILYLLNNFYHGQINLPEL